MEALEAGEGGIEIEIEESNEEQDSQAELETGEEEDDDDNDNDEDEEGEQTETETTTQTESPTAEPASGPRRMITRNMLLQLLGHENLRQIFADPSALTGGESDEGTTSGGWGLGRLRSRNTGSRPVPPQPPFKEGQELQRSGIYGRNERQTDTIKRRKKMQYRIMQRELGLGSPARHRSIQPLIAQSLIPSSEADTIIHYDSRCYSGQFSDDGNFFFSCAQDFKVRMYDTSNPYHWKYYKTVNYPYGQWTITDASLSPDNKFLAYSSIRSIVCLAPTDPLEKSDPYLLDFADTGGRGSRGFGGYSHFGIWSLRFSGDGREIVAGTSDRSVYVYDIETRKSILRIPGHDDDVNAVCFGDKSSPHVLFSGSDDSTLKVWDRRSLGEGREAGVFIGHTEGLTYVDSKGDGRYVLSNGKDQSMKLWDLRKMISTEKAERIDNASYSQGFDYRFMPYNEAMYRPHPHDCSVVSFRGHRVLKTLIRCHFSPPGSTDSRYVYSGSEDGKVWIYNIDGTLAGKVDVNRATKDSRPRNDALFMETYDMEGGRGEWKTCVRDASWHPNAPVVAGESICPFLRVEQSSACKSS